MSTQAVNLTGDLNKANAAPATNIDRPWLNSEVDRITTSSLSTKVGIYFFIWVTLILYWTLNLFICFQNKNIDLVKIQSVFSKIATRQ